MHLVASPKELDKSNINPHNQIVNEACDQLCVKTFLRFQTPLWSWGGNDVRRRRALCLFRNIFSTFGFLRISEIGPLPLAIVPPIATFGFLVSPWGFVALFARWRRHRFPCGMAMATQAKPTTHIAPTPTSPALLEPARGDVNRTDARNANEFNLQSPENIGR